MKKRKLSRETLRNPQEISNPEALKVAGGWVCNDNDTTCPSMPRNSCRCSDVC
jgi:hypothetical protein